MKFIKKLFGAADRKNQHTQVILEKICGATDVGKLREGNEDYFMVIPEKNLYIVADGMGGHNAGEVASLTAVEEVDGYLTSEFLSQISDNGKKIEDEMTKSLLAAHHKVIELANGRQEFRGMGCTIVAALIDGNSLHLLHVGDARAYVGNDSGINLLTTDHSTVMKLVKAGKMTMEEARTSPIKSELTQAIGASISIVPEYNHYPLQDGDKILLCSDGLWDMLPDEEIYKILKQKKPAKALCEELINAANDAGGNDNITVVTIEHKKSDPPPEEENP